MKTKTNKSLTRISVIALFFLHHVSTFGWFSSFFMPPMVKPEYVVTVMLACAGDGQNPGRTIENTFERTIGIHYVERLKMMLEDQYSSLRILVARTPGETTQALHNAQYANRAQVDLYISFNFYKEEQVKPTLFFYTFSNTTIISKYSELSFVPYDKAHMNSYASTQRYAGQLKNVLESDHYASLFECKGVFAIPFKPLIGIQAPAIGLEIGLKNADTWQDLIAPIAHGLKPIIEAIQKTHAA